MHVNQWLARIKKSNFHCVVCGLLKNTIFMRCTLIFSLFRIKLVFIFTFWARIIACLWLVFIKIVGYDILMNMSNYLMLIILKIHNDNIWINSINLIFSIYKKDMYRKHSNAIGVLALRKLLYRLIILSIKISWIITIS